MSAIPTNDWSVQATLTVDAETEAAATTAVTAALAAITAALTSGSIGAEFSVPENEPDVQAAGNGLYAFDYNDEVNGGFYLEGQLLVPSVAESEAQSIAEAAAAAITNAVSSLTPTTKVTLEVGEEGGYVFNLLQ